MTADAFVLLYGAALGRERLAEILASNGGFRCSAKRVEQLLAGDVRPACDPTWATLFWTHAEKADPHWRWHGHRDRHGVGKMNITRDGVRGPVSATRLSLLLHLGEIPDGMLVVRCHDEPACVNPAHLTLATKGDVSRINGNARRGEAHPLAKLTADKVREIRVLAAEGESYQALGERYGVARATARDAVVGRRWASVA